MKTEAYIRKIVDRVLAYLDELGIAEAFADTIAAKLAQTPASAPPLAASRAPQLARAPVDPEDLRAQISNIFKCAPERYMTASHLAKSMVVPFADARAVLDRLVDDGALTTTPGRKHGVRYWLKGRARGRAAAKNATPSPLAQEVLTLVGRGAGSSEDIARMLGKRFPVRDVQIEIARLSGRGVITVNEHGELEVGKDGAT